MPSNKPMLAIRTNENLIKKLKKISDEENRSMSNMGEKIITEYIKKWEENNGKIIDT